MKNQHDPLSEPVIQHMRHDYTTLPLHTTVGEAFALVRETGVAEKIVYFYVVNDEGVLTGVIPTRRLLTAAMESPVSEIMIPRVVAISDRATLLEACEMFIMHKFLAFPVTDQEGKIRGVIDVSYFTEELLDLAERERMDELFESIGFRVSQVRDASVLKSFRFRFPWLISTILSGTICALLAGFFEATLAESIVLAFFITLVLGLGESVSIQSMTVTIQALRLKSPDLKWYLKEIKKEAGVSILLGLACAVAVFTVVMVWKGNPMEATSIGLSIVLAITAACFFGLSVPSLLHALKLDPKIAAGPLTLALADISTLIFYFTIGTIIL